MNISAVIFEDEKLSAERFLQLLNKYSPEIKVLEIISSIQKGIEWFKENELPDLIFLDIHLSDGNAFEMLNGVDLKSTPVIFTTAYDEYAIKAFEINSIAYLVKPIEYKQLERALGKFKQLRDEPKKLAADFYQKLYGELKARSKTRFLSKVGETFNYVEVKDISYFMYDGGYVWLMKSDGKKFPLETSLEKIETEINPDVFFRVNRRYIVKLEAIEQIKSHTNSRLKLQLKPSIDEEVIVSRDRVSSFKEWLDL